MRLVTLGTARYSSDRPRRALSSPPTLATAVPNLGMLCAARHQIAEYHPRCHLSTTFLATYPCVIPTMLSCR